MAKIIRVWDGSAWQEVGTALPNALTTDGTQTLTNKTINLTSNTLTGTTAQFNTALSDANFTTLAGSETLTNKSIALGSNTITGTINQFNTALTDANFATAAGSETLTNKTISGADNTLTNIANASLTNSSITINGSAVSLGGSTTIAGGSAQNSAPSSPTEGQLWLDTDSTNASLQFIENSNLTDAGDIIYASAANTPARLGIGSSGQLLQVASGIPSWSTYIPQLNEQKFTSSGTFTVPTGITKVWTTVVGGGGQGGASGFSLGINFGGTAGAYLTEQVTVTPGATVSVTVGAGNGNASSFGSLSASGGYSPGGFYDATGNGIKYAGVGESAYGIGGTGNTSGNGNAAPSNSGAGGGAASSGGTGGNGGSGIIIVRWIA